MTLDALIADLWAMPPYGLPYAAKTRLLAGILAALTRHHYSACPPYRAMVDAAFAGVDALSSATPLEALPFVPASLFKSVELRSVPEAEVLKVLTSSGTTGQAVSRIYLDRHTARLQSIALVKLMNHFIGGRRRPMIVVDSPGVIKDRHSYSARGAGILGMLQFGTRPVYALKDDLSLDVEVLQEYSASHAGEPILLFGFTFIIWEKLIGELQRRNIRLNLRGGVLFHSGGWKKLKDKFVTNMDFRNAATDWLGVASVVNFYGMVEQVGSVFFENPAGFLQAPLFSEIIIRDPRTLRTVPDGVPGLVQVLSCLPRSYPGHSLLTEDVGVVRGRDHVASGMGGTYFELLGRLPTAEIRGCSDTFAA